MTKIRTIQIYRGTTAQNNAYTGAAGELTMDTTSNELRLHDGTTAGGHIVNGSGYRPDLFSWQWSDHEINDMQWLRADTFSWQSKTAYEVAYNHLVDDVTGITPTTETIAGTTITVYVATDGHKIVLADQESNVTAIYTATGVAWYYILDTVNQRFKLPRTQFGATGLRDTVGKYVEAGLPNITGKFKVRNNPNGNPQGNITDTEGAFSSEDSVSGGYTKFSADENSYTGNTTAVFDASDSNSIYGNGTTVQPKATQMHLYFYVGNFTQTALENTAGLNASLFNAKVDLTSAWGFPDGTNTVLTLGASGTQYTAPADGWFSLYAQYAGGSNTAFDMYHSDNSGFGYRHWFGSADVNAAGRGFVPVKKGQKITIYINGSLQNVDFRFIYAQKTN